jgi:hypothetical protein
MTQYNPPKLHVTDGTGDAAVPDGCSLGIDDEFGAEGGRNYYLFTAVNGDPDELAEQARRMVASWNACRGVEVEALEGHAIQVVAAEHSQIKAERDALLAAINDLMQHVVGDLPLTGYIRDTDAIRDAISNLRKLAAEVQPS